MPVISVIPFSFLLLFWEWVEQSFAWERRQPAFSGPDSYGIFAGDASGEACVGMEIRLR